MALRRISFAPFAFLVSAAAIGALAMLLFRHEQTFPDIPPGAYTGRISGVRSEKEFSTLYVERIRNADALLFVVFEAGWKPQVVQADQTARKKYLGLFGTAPALKPISITGPAGALLLAGSGGGREFSGQAESGGKRAGAWSLSPVAVSDLRRPPPVSDEAFDLREWLRLKGRAHVLKLEHDQLTKTANENDAHRRKLAQFLEREDLLRLRAQERLGTVKEELNQAIKQEADQTAELKQLARELGQLARITRRGQAIELARRVAKRESKWYMVNWQQGSDLSGLEESLAADMNVDILKLRTNLKRAEELQTLRSTVEQERARVLQLQQLYREKVDAGMRRTPQQQQRPQQPRSWWQRWDSLFGGENEGRQ